MENLLTSSRTPRRLVPRRLAGRGTGAATRTRRSPGQPPCLSSSASKPTPTATPATSAAASAAWSIMRALMAEPKVLLLDEPMAGVHPNLARRIGGQLVALTAGGLTVLMVEHELAIMDEFCDRWWPWPKVPSWLRAPCRVEAAQRRRGGYLVG